MKCPVKRQPLTRLAHFFDFLLTISLFVSAVFAIVFVGFSIYLGFGGEGFDALDMGVDVPAGLADGTIFDSAGRPVPVTFKNVEIRIPVGPGRGDLLVAAFIGAGGFIALVLIGLFHLRQLVHSLRVSHPFIEPNAERLSKIAWLALVVGIWDRVAAFLVELEVSRSFRSEELVLGNYMLFSGDYLLFVLFLFMIAEVFKVGVEMKAEQDLTV